MSELIMDRYIEGWKGMMLSKRIGIADPTISVIELANDVFGFNGWSSSIVSLKMDFVSGSLCHL
jgi:recombination DNA repair RAD52 pathway protein